MLTLCVELRNVLPHSDGVALLDLSGVAPCDTLRFPAAAYQHAGHDTLLRRADIDGNLVGLYLQDDVVCGDGFPNLLENCSNAAFGNGLAHRGHRDVYHWHSQHPCGAAERMLLCDGWGMAGQRAAHYPALDDVVCYPLTHVDKCYATQQCCMTLHCA